jgi:hypothetical protein
MAKQKQEINYILTQYLQMLNAHGYVYICQLCCLHQVESTRLQTLHMLIQLEPLDLLIFLSKKGGNVSIKQKIKNIVPVVTTYVHLHNVNSQAENVLPRRGRIGMKKTNKDERSKKFEFY